MEMPSFLQSKQLPADSVTSDRKKKYTIIVLAVLLFAIPLTVWLAQRSQIFNPRAAGGPIELVSGTDSCVISTDPNKVSCGNFPIKVTSPLGPPASATPSPSPTPVNSSSPSPSEAACTTTATNVSSSVISNNQISYTLNYPANSKITQVSLPATPGFAFRVGSQNGASGAALNAELGDGTDNVVITVTGDANKSCSAYTINFTMLNQCGQTINRFLGPGSASAYGAFCQSSPSPSASLTPSPAASPVGTTGVSSGTDELGVNLQSEGTCQAGSPVVVFSNQARADTNNFRLYRDGQPLSYTFAGIFSRPPTTQMKDTGLNLNTSYSYYIQAVDGPLAGKRSNVSTVSTPNTCPSQGLGKVKNKFAEVLGYIQKTPERLVQTMKVRETYAQSSQTPSSISCMNNALSLTNPVTAVNNKQPGTSFFFWNQSVNRDTFIAKAAECGLSILNPGNFNGADVKSLVESVAGVPSSSVDGSKYRNVIVEGPCSAQKFAAYQAAGHNMLPDNQCGTETGIDYKVNQYYGPGSGLNPYAVVNGLADGGPTGYPMVIATSSATVSPSPSSSATASASATPLPSGPGTVSFKVAETEAGLESAETIPYTTHGQIYDFAFSTATPGVKQIWVEFIGADGTTNRQHIAVEIIEPAPQLTSVDCSLDISGQNLKVTLNGSRLGSGGGKVTVDEKDAQIVSWASNQVIASIKPEGDLENGKLFKVVLTRNDSKILPEVSCQVGTTLISLGARLFCREPGKFDINNVKVTLVDENGNKVTEDVTVDSAGIIKNLKTRLQVGKLYAISVKAPYSLRKNAQFTAANGTNIIAPSDGQPFILPVGDIAPVILQDGKINTLDRAEIVRQWSVLGSATKTGDFNRDTKVNSIDWACMRYDFNAEDEVIPAQAQSTSPSPLPSMQPSASVTSSPSVSAAPSPTPQTSEGRSAFFLIELVEPIAGGRYVLGDEFIVDVKISSAIEAANLFSAKLSFDPTRLEVVRIEKGTALTSWVEEVFNNQAGTIALTAGLPNPGLLTSAETPPTMARIIFNSKKMGIANLAVTEASKIFSNATNLDILKQYVSQDIEIVIQ